MRNMAVFFVTNYYERIDRALSRSGRIDYHLVILPYTKQAQISVANGILSRKELPNKSTILQDFETVVQDLPCSLGYRDIEQLLAALEESKPVDEVKTIGKSLGTNIRSYSSKKRINAYREFVALVKRYFGKAPESSQMSALSELEAAGILKTLGEEIQVAHPEVSSFLDRWCHVLTERVKREQRV
jgi:hypothetical protein